MITRVSAGFAHDLSVHLAARRHVHNQVALDPCRAGQPVARWQRAAAGELLLGRTQRRQILGPRGDAVLGEFAFHDQHLAAAAQCASAADGVDIHAQRTRCLK